MTQYDEGAAVQFFGLLNMLTAERCSETGLFRQLFSHLFRSL